MCTHVGAGSGGRSGGVVVRGPPEDLPYTLKGLKHISIAVPDLASAAEHYRCAFGAQVSAPVVCIYVPHMATSCCGFSPLNVVKFRTPRVKDVNLRPAGENSVMKLSHEALTFFCIPLWHNFLVLASYWRRNPLLFWTT